MIFLFSPLLLLPGCSTHQCDASTSSADGGQVTEYNGTWTWQTSSIQSGWIPFNGQETITFTLPSNFPPVTTPGFVLFPMVSTGAGQDVGDGTFTPASGQLTEFQIVGPRSFTAYNNACADYYLRVVAMVTVAPAPVDAGPDATHD